MQSQLLFSVQKKKTMKLLTGETKLILESSLEKFRRCSFIIHSNEISGNLKKKRKKLCLGKRKSIGKKVRSSVGIDTCGFCSIVFVLRIEWMCEIFGKICACLVSVADSKVSVENLLYVYQLLREIRSTWIFKFCSYAKWWHFFLSLAQFIW